MVDRGTVDRGHAIPVKDWWLRLARSLVSKDARDFKTLGRDLAKHVRRKSPFSHSMLSRFASGQGDPKSGKPVRATLELAEALCAEFSRLPPPVLFPRSYEEAVHMQGVAERYDGDQHEGGEDALIVPMPKPRRNRSTATATPAVDVVPAKRRSRG